MDGGSAPATVERDMHASSRHEGTSKTVYSAWHEESWHLRQNPGFLADGLVSNGHSEWISSKHDSRVYLSFCVVQCCLLQYSLRTGAKHMATSRQKLGHIGILSYSRQSLITNPAIYEAKRPCQELYHDLACLPCQLWIYCCLQPRYRNAAISSNSKPFPCLL